MSGSLESHREHILVGLLKSVFVTVPLTLAGFVLSALSRIRPGFPRRALIGAMVLCYAVFCLLAGMRGMVLKRLDYLSPSYAASLKAVICYGIYIVLSFPVFMLFAYGASKREQPLKNVSDRSLNLSLSWMRHERLKSSGEKIFLGGSFRTGKPVFLTDDMRVMHTQVVGSTGSGKTESILLPMLAHDIRAGKGAIILDGKGDLDVRDKIWWIMNANKREEDFYFFSLSYPEHSHTYNPLLKGNATEIKDKLIGSTVWSEEFYKKKSEEALLKLLRPMVEKKDKIRFGTLYTYLTNKSALDRFKDTITDEEMKNDIKEMVDNFHFAQKFLAGIIADLALMAKSEFAPLIEVDEPDIDLLEVYKKNKVVYFQLNVQGYEETARRMGRLILQDIKSVSNHIQSRFTPLHRHFFGVFIDEFGSFVHENFIDFLNKARGAGFAVTMLHQSLGDLIPQGKKSFGFQQQVIENTNLKIILRQDDPGSVERFAKIAGTKPTLISTYQTAERLFGKGFTGVGSLREGQTFHIEPDLIRTLRKGEAVFIRKHPSFHVDHLKLDFFGHPGVIPKFLPKKEKEKPKEVVGILPCLENSSQEEEKKTVAAPALPKPKPEDFFLDGKEDLWMQVERIRKGKQAGK